MHRECCILKPVGGADARTRAIAAPSHREAYSSARFVPEPESCAPRLINQFILIMRLHLPKRLLRAVLTALVTTSAALFTLGSSAYAGQAGGVFYINSAEKANSDASMADYASFAEGTYTFVNTDPTGKPAVTSIQPGDSFIGTITTLKVDSGKSLDILANTQTAGVTKRFSNLTISSVEVADSGSAKLSIDGEQVVSIGGATGTVNFEAKSSGAAQLIFNGNGTYGTYTTIGPINNYDREISVTNSSIVSFTTITNSWGMSAIDVGAGSQLTAGTISFRSGNNGSGDGQGGKITGDGKVKVTTFETGNVGNYTVSVNNFEATAINAACASDKTLTLSSANLTVGTLTQTQGKVVLSSTNATIDRLVLSGGSLTNNGTLTITGSSSGGSLTNNGTLTITGSFSGATIAQGDQGCLVLDGAVINLDRLTVVASATWDGASEGWQAQSNTSEYRLMNGGRIESNNAEFRVGGSRFSNATISNTGVVSIKAARYNILASGIASISDIAASASEEQIAADGYYINVLDGGTLTGVSGVLNVGVSGAGKIQTVGEIQFDDRFIAFTGTIELGAGGMKSSNKSFTSNNNLVLTADSKITSQDGTVNTIGGVISSSGDFDLAIAGNGVTMLTAANTFMGRITVKSGATLMLSNSSNNMSGSGLITVEANSCLDLNGRSGSDKLPNVTLSGGTLKNSGAGKDTAAKQLAAISLTADSTIDAASQFGLVNHMYSDATLDLDSYTLTKTGNSIFHAVSTAVTGTGKIRIEGGSFNLESKDGYTASSLGEGVNVELAGGSLIGSFVNIGTSTIHAVQNGTVSATITNNGTLNVTGGEGRTVTFSGAIRGGKLELDGDLVTMNVSGNLTTATLKKTSGTALNYSGAAINGATLDAVTLTKSDGYVTVNGTSTIKNIINRTLGNDKGYAMVVTSGGSLSVQGVNDFTETTTSGDTTTSYSGLIGVESGGLLTVEEDAVLTVKGLFNSSATASSNGNVTLKVGGTLNVVGNNSNTYVNDLTIEGSGEKTTAATFDGKLNVNSTLSIANGGSVEMKGADSSITTLTGSGSLKVSGNTGVTDASRFSGSLESGAAMLIISGVKGLKALKSNVGGRMWAATGTDENSSAITSIKIDEVVLAGGEATISIKDSASNATVQTKSLVVSAASALSADLTLLDNAGLVVNVEGVTAETATAICSLNGALTLGSKLSLTLSNLGKFKAGDSIKLFSGVTGVTYTIPPTGGETEVAALSEDVGTTGTLDADGIDASQVFSNVAADTYTLKFENNIVSLVAQRDVPEPTTATLSLLALMGLAARRRRKA